MQKRANTRYPVIELIRERWSQRCFSPAPVSTDDMNTLLEAASWSFSSGNLQPWYYLYAHRGTPGFEKILSGLSEGNQAWAGEAAVLLVTLAKKERDPGKPNLKARHDLGAANMLLVLQAVSMGMFGHPMGGYDADILIDKLDIDSAVYEPVACIAVGYPGDPEKLEASLKVKEYAPRTRKSIEEISRNVT
jgi:nitroreductase